MPKKKEVNEAKKVNVDYHDPKHPTNVEVMDYHDVNDPTNKKLEDTHK